jgi:hypothetical protein
MPKLVVMAVTVAMAAAVARGPALAEPLVKTIGIDEARAVLICPKRPTASVILIPGGDGRIEVGYDGAIQRLRNNQLVRTRFAYAARGLAVLVVDAEVDLTLAVDVMRRVKSPVTVIAGGHGTLRAAKGIADGARPDALVLVSGALTDASGGNPNVAKILGTPDRLPPTLVIQHRQDKCDFSRPAGVAPFIKWTDGRARAVWLDGGHNGGDPCDGQAHHGFAGLDARVVAVSAAFH